MTLALILAFLVAAWLAVCLYGHGSANTIDQLAWWLHRWAVNHRQMVRQRESFMTSRWIRELEK